jgi:hypothetical protein
LSLVLWLTVGTAYPNAISFYTTVQDTDFSASAIGMRDLGTGDLTVSGVSGAVTRALLFWHGPSNSSDPNANANVTFGGTEITGTNIGFSDDNFWGAANSQAYRSDVTSLVSGNGSYSLADFQKLPTALINGAALFVFFDDGNTANDRDVVLFNGNDANFASAFDAPGWNVTLSGINYTSGTAALTMYVSDGQDFGPGDDGTVSVNATGIATGGVFQGLAPRTPGAGVSNGSLTDLQTYDVTSFLSPGLNSLNVTLNPGVSDALSAVVLAVDLPAGAAPPTVVPEPSTLALMAAGMCAVLLVRRRKSLRGGAPADSYLSG